jgi:transcriptional regulator with GAF, ATPase, and Fis domain
VLSSPQGRNRSNETTNGNDSPLIAKLLAGIAGAELERIGDTRTRKVSVRVIAATDRDLRKEVDQGRFREGLFYRLSVFPIEAPPLRNSLAQRGRVPNL